MVKTDNRTVGGRFEQDLAVMLAEHGFWVHILQQTKAGQPADLIAVKGRFHTLIDCKVISDSRGFPMDRIEENQRLAMGVFRRKCGEMCYFAMKLPDGEIRMAACGRLETLAARGRKRLTEEEIREQMWPLDEWLIASDNWSRDI